MMNFQRHISMKARILLAGAALAMLAFGSNANASVVRIHFHGAAGSGYADLTLDPVADPDNQVNTNSPALTVTGASGSFNGAMITGVRGYNAGPPAPGEVLPASYSIFSIPGVGDHDGVTYDNLFYPDGSPVICLIDGTPVYPFGGGFLDLMGIMFALDNGEFVDLWSFGKVDPTAGVFPPFVSGLTYGLKVIQPTTDGGYAVVAAPPFATASVAEPEFLWLFGAGLLGLFAWRRSLDLRKRN